MPRTSRKQRLEAQRKNRLFPGPKMRPRPPDFDEELVRRAPTFAKWLKLKDGETLKYACRTFVKGVGDDEERLMRRIMIARRNNLKDHANLKRARALEAGRVKEEDDTALNVTTVKQEPSVSSPADTEKKEEELLTRSLQQSYVANPSGTKRRYIPGKLRASDDDILKEMDIPAVEATRSYRKWLTLQDGETLCYNQEYVKGDPEQDWLLRKNIWRRMRYRRENSVKVREMQEEEYKSIAGEESMYQVQSVVDAAVAAAAAAHEESYGFDAAAVAALDHGGVVGSGTGVNDPLVSGALDAAARLAASVLNPDPLADVGGEDEVVERIQDV